MFFLGKRKIILIVSIVAVVLVAVLVFFIVKNQSARMSTRPASEADKSAAKGVPLAIAQRPESEEEPEPPIGMHRGSAKILSQPEGAAVEVQFDGETKKGKTPLELDVPFQGDEIALKIRASHDGYNDAEQFLLLTAEEPARTVELSMVRIGKSSISVLAVPWGKFGIDTRDAMRDAPGVGIQVEPGAHTIWAHYPPSGKWLKTTVDVGPNASVRCMADFTTYGEMNCR